LKTSRELFHLVKMWINALYHVLELLWEWKRDVVGHRIQSSFKTN